MGATRHNPPCNAWSADGEGGGHYLSSLIPVLVTGIQPACVCKPKRLLESSSDTDPKWEDISGIRQQLPSIERQDRAKRGLGHGLISLPNQLGERQKDHTTTRPTAVIALGRVTPMVEY